MALLAALLLAVAFPASAKPPVDYQPPPPDPPAAGQIERPGDGHLRGRIPDRLTGPGMFQRLPMIDESQWVVVASRAQPYWKAGVRDPVLTNACRLGDFATLPLNRLVVKFTAEEGRGFLQIVPPTHRHLLFDRRKLARPKETYYFRDTGLPSCEVWVEGEARPRVLDRTRGTSLPPPDRKALQKRKALINSWPKAPPGP